MNDYQEARLTAYALGELGPSGRAEVEAWVARDPSMRRQLEAIIETAALLRDDLANEPPLALTALQRASVVGGPVNSARGRSRAAFVIAGLAAAATLMFAAWPRGSEPRVEPERSLASVPTPRPPPVVDPEAPGPRVELPPVAAELAPDSSPRLTSQALDAILLDPVATWLEQHPEQRIYVQVDKPLYRPGETIWVKSWEVAARDLGRVGSPPTLTYELIDPRGAAIATKLVATQGGRGHNDFELAPGAPGGEYTVRASDQERFVGERKVIVASYQAPRIKKKLELLRKAYGPGDEVVATLELHRPTGEPVEGQAVAALIRLDGEELPRVATATNAAGGALVRVRLPDTIDIGDALLTVLVTDGGVTESVSKRVPIPLRKMRLDFYPEGGDLVEGLPSRVYVAARDTLGKPADFRGRIVDDEGRVAADVASLKNGMGRFALTPVAGRRYFAEVTEPVGVAARYALPEAAARGCALRTFDDFDGQVAAVRVAVRCDERREVIVGAVQAERFIDAARIVAGPADDTVVHLASEDAALMRAQGVARVTLFDEHVRPLAERVVYRNRRNRLSVKVTPDRERYSPQDEVTLAIETRDARGELVAAELAVSVVDDTVVSHADDKAGHILAKLLLEPELVGDVEEPNFYLDLTEKDSAAALDLLMGTQGYRRFDWDRALTPPAVATTRGMRVIALVEQPIEALDPAAARPLDVADALPPEVKPPDDLARVDKLEEKKGEKVIAAAMVIEAPREAPEPDATAPVVPEGNQQGLVLGLGAPAQVAGGEDEDPAKLPVGGRPEHAGVGRFKNQVGPNGRFGQDLHRVLAPVRVFPIPASRVTAEDGVRSDFRTTVLWAPSVITDADGRAQVKLRLSDAVTSFRAFAEGIAGGAVGRSETVLASSLPFSMSVKVPAAVTARDALRLPLTLTNETDAPRVVKVLADLGGLLTSTDPTLARTVELPAKGRATIWFGARPGTRAGQGRVTFTATSDGLSDAFTQELTVMPLGFPVERTFSGDLGAAEAHELQIDRPVEGTLDVSLTVYPSPIATMLGGLDGILREPTGCFEQASATNYPNVMVMNYLERHEVDDAALAGRTHDLLTRGYARLTGYETSTKGYEWFGSTPGHEALSAYGLLQFRDMQAVFPEVDEAMIGRTAQWLLSRRDGAGGFKVNPQALDSFGAASRAVTDAYIMWSLVASRAVDVTTLGPELARVAQTASSTRDAYVLSLSANTLLGVAEQREAGLAAAARLVAMQDEDGAWTKADHSITRSGGENLTIETTAIAALALMESGAHIAELDRAAAWIRGARGPEGNFGTTQATVLALKALTRYEEQRRVTRSAGTITVLVDDVAVGELRYAPGERGPLLLAGLGADLKDGHHRITLRHDGVAPMPYTLAATWRTAEPRTSPGVAVDLTTTVDRPEVAMGELVRLTATVTNTTVRGQPMTLARIGIPGGLSFQTWQLQELRDRGVIGFYETTPREVILYFRDLAPGAVKVVPLDLVATVPGTYRASESQAYLYYTDDLKAWADGVTVTVR